MDLGEKWEWKGRKLACRVEPESGNPAGDDLRQRFVELAGKDMEEMGKLFDTLDNLKNTKKKMEVEKKGAHIDHKADRKFNEVLSRKHILGATQLAMKTIDDKEFANATTVTQKNLKKRFARLPVSPPPRVLLQIQRERSKPPTVVESEDLIAKRAKLEKKLEKQRLKRMEAMKADETIAEGYENSSSQVKKMLTETFPSNMNSGDLFGTHGDDNNYLGSMLYMSRMSGGLEKSKRMKRNEATVASLLPVDTKDEDGKKDKKRDHDDDGNDTAQEQDDQSRMSGDQGTDVSAKLFCVASLCNWSRNSSNASRLAQEGGVRAIIQLMSESNTRILRFATAAFRFMSEDAVLSISMIEEGAVSCISDVVKTPVDEFASTNLAVALVNLTRINGKEAVLVEGSMVLALHNLMMNRPELSALCARGLYNLTCVDGMYPLMERLIRTIVTVSASSIAAVKHICAASLCNLSDLKLMRPRLVEEGAIAVLSTLSRHAPTRTRRVCAVILQNLSATKSCRVEMVIRSSVHVAHGLSSDKDPIILRCVGLTLARLSTEPVNSARIVQEYGVSALCNIAMKFSSVPGISQPVSTALQLLAQQPSTRIAAVQEGCVTSIATLLANSKDLFTLQSSLYALSNLLIEPENHLPIVQQGLILTIVSMCEHEDALVKDLCAFAFFNMSCAVDSRKHIVNAGAIPSLITLSIQDSSLTKQRCAAALCNVSAYEAGMSRMVSDGIIPALVSLLSEDDITIHYACAALCRLCLSQENSEMISSSGGVSKLVSGALNGDTITRRFCGAVLSTLSFYDSCRAPLVELGSIGALKNLAKEYDDDAQQRCLVAFANMSCDKRVQGRMVEEGVVAITADLIGNSYQEKNYICCAKALCNLACAEKTRVIVAQQGGVNALMMISMVHSVDRQTKLLCVMALYNLLDATTVDFMLEEGICKSVANLSKQAHPKILKMCAHMLNYLTRFEQGGIKMTEKAGLAHSAIAVMLQSDDEDTKMAAARTTANLVLSSNKDVAATMIRGGAFDILERGCLLEDPSASKQCVAAIFRSCTNPQFLQKLGELNASKTFLSVSGDKEVNLLIAKIMAMLAADTTSRPYLQKKDVFVPLIEQASKNTDVECGRWFSNAIRCVSNGYSDHYSMMTEGIVGALGALHALEDDEGVISSSNAETIRLFIEGNKMCIEDLASEATVNILARAVSESKKNADQIRFILYNCALVMMECTCYSPVTRDAVAIDAASTVLSACMEDHTCYDLAIAVMYQFYTDPKTRGQFSTSALAAKITHIMQDHPTEGCLMNAVSALWSLSKLPSSRDYLSEPPVHADVIALKLTQGENVKLKANATRLLKNLQSDANEAIEEGAVAALIAISLEGKAQRSKVSSEMISPEINPVGETVVPDYGVELVDFSKFTWYLEKKVTMGGAAGRGPGLPEPPIMDGNRDQYTQFSVEELDSSELEGKAKMSFAKMQIPDNMRTQHLLTDADFDVKEDDGSQIEESSQVESVVVGGTMENSLADSNSLATFGKEFKEPESKEGISEEKSASPKEKGSEVGVVESKKIDKKSAKGKVKKKSDTASSKPGMSAKEKGTTQPKMDKSNAEIGQKAQALGLY